MGIQIKNLQAAYEDTVIIPVQTLPYLRKNHHADRAERLRQIYASKICGPDTSGKKVKFFWMGKMKNMTRKPLPEKWLSRYKPTCSG